MAYSTDANVLRNMTKENVLEMNLPLFSSHNVTQCSGLMQWRSNIDQKIRSLPQNHPDIKILVDFWRILDNICNEIIARRRAVDARMRTLKSYVR